MSEFREVQVTFDCADPRTLSLFWADVLGYRLDPPPPGFDSWEAALAAWGVPEEHWNDKSAVSDADGRGPRLFFQRVPEPKSTKNRLHLDVRAAPGTEGAEREAALNAEADRLVALGARVVEPFHVDPMGAAFIVMSDPEGNEFCLD